MRREALKIMQRYMAAIYRMTTVNHDHLFAACLKKSPVSRIEHRKPETPCIPGDPKRCGFGQRLFPQQFRKGPGPPAHRRPLP
jgi:hypothetical protein